MNELSRQIQLLLPKEKQFLHQIYTKTIQDYAYLWEEFEDIEKLRKIILFIVKLFYIEHKGLKDLSKLDKEKFKKSFRELLTNHDALLQKTRRSQIREIEGIGAEEWLKLIKKDIMTISKIIEDYENPNLVEKTERNIQYDGLSWKIPRTTLDLLCAYIQFGFRYTSSPPYTCLLNSKEKKEFYGNIREAKIVWEQKPTPRDRLEFYLRKYANYRQPSQPGVSGDIFLSKAFDDPSKKRLYTQYDTHARLSFSLNVTLTYSFFDWIMKLMRESILSDIPIKLKIDDMYPGGQGNGENAHIYFHVTNEGELYKALTEYIYPTMVKHRLNALGGRFLMIPIENRNGNILKGIEFGQDLYRRANLQIKEREKISIGVHATRATSQVINYTLNLFYSRPDFTQNFERFKEIYKKQGRGGLLNDKSFNAIYSSVRQKLIEIGRDPDYPILDRDARKIFPNFTRAIQK